MYPFYPVWLHQRSAQLSSELRKWLYDSGSLTQNLIQASEGDFSLRVINQGLEVPRLDECRALKLPHRQLALIREIVMSGYGQDWVFARSVVPISSLDGQLRHLKSLGNQPLGALLFKDPSMRRGPIETTLLNKSLINIPCTQAAWARRSVFRINNKPLLVSEVFLPSFSPVYGHPNKQLSQ